MHAPKALRANTMTSSWRARGAALILVSVSAAGGWLFVACSDSRPGAAGDGTNPGANSATCQASGTGCACDTPGAVVACGSVEHRSADYVSCSMGHHVCLPSGLWGECSAETEIRTKSFENGLHFTNLADASATCLDNPCDPYCQAYTDDPTGLLLPDGGGLEVVDGGLELAPTGVASLGSCTGLQITPSTATLTITNLSPVMPDKIDFSADLVPAGCYPGAVHPLYTVDDPRADSVTIQSAGPNGHLRVTTPIAGPVTVSAYLGPFVATALAQINVDVLDTTAAPMGYAASFPTPTGVADALTLLYPYANTVFPLALPPPIPQWSGAPAANAVKVSLRYVNGATSFQWAAIAPENAPLTIVPPSVALAAAPRFPTIPQNAWFLFERSARGQNANIVVQRHAGGSLRTELATPIRFANGQLKGNVYYQSYGTQLARNFTGGAIDSTGGLVFPGGAFGAATMGIAPGATAPTVIAGSTGGNPPDGAGTYCRVCHTASADGSLLVTQKFGGGNTTSQRYSNLAGVPAGVDIAPGDGRFSWPAIFPTGGTATGFLFGNAGPMANFGAGPAPGGLDGSNSALTSALYSLATGTLGSGVAGTYRTTGATPITINVPSAGWGLQAAVPAFSAAGTKVAMQAHAGKVCATAGAANCTADELAAGDKQSIATMDFNPATKQFTNFKVVVKEPNTPCDTRFHPTQPCFDVWPTFMPNGAGLVYEKEIFHNGSVGASASPLSDFGGTRSGCDTNATCNNDGTKGELWWASLAGAATPTRLNAAIGLRPDNTSYLPVGPNAPTSCRVTGMACAAGAQCCSNSCTNGRCASTLKSVAGATCGSAAACESNACVGGFCGCSRDADCAAAPCNTAAHTCPGNVYYTPPAQAYIPGHNAVVEPELNYEPTMNPTPTPDAAGTPEFYWVVFTSRRMLGNIATVDPWWSDPRRQDISKTVTPKKLWVAAVRANPAAGTDPSFPAFYLPGQEWISGNSKAYWVQQACRVGDVTHPPTSACDTTQDCCAGSTCRLATPVANPPARFCEPVLACVGLGGMCSVSSDCCAGRICSGGTCQDPPPIPSFGASATFDRDLVGTCATGSRAVWRFFDFQATLPAGTSIVFRARTATSAAALPTATPLVTIGTASPPSTVGWTTFAQTVDDALRAAGSQSAPFLRVEMQLNPSADASSTPVLLDWRTHYSCVPNE